MSPAPGRLLVRAFAKINWTLEVVRLRDDGFHELRTVLQTVALHDELAVSWPAGADSLHIDGTWGADVPAGEGNLALRALAVYRAALPAQSALPFVALSLHKGIPPAAGLGGGSSDGAAALRALDIINPRPLGAAALEELAARFGSDAPFFVRGGTQLATGRGDLLAPLPDAPPTWLVLVLPDAAAERKTARLFALLQPADFADGPHSRALAAVVTDGAGGISLSMLFNTFERVEARAFPGLAAARAALERRLGHASLCGSGPSLFALAGGEAEARRAAAELVGQGRRAVAVRTVAAAASTAVER